MSEMATTSEQPSASGKAASPKSSKMHRRSRSGCFTCRLRRKKCSEEKPRCKACRNLGLDCEYKRPSWWGNNESRRKQKDLIKSVIKRTKTNEKTSVPDPSSKLHHAMRHGLPMSESYTDNFGRFKRADSEDSDDLDDNALDPTFCGTPGYYDPHAQQYYGPPYAQPDIYGHGYTYEVDVKTERQMFVNDVPTRRDSSISTFSTLVPPPPHAVLPSYTGDEFLQQGCYQVPQDEWTGEEGLDFNFFDFSHGQQAHHQEAQTAMIPVEDQDRPLLDHLLENVLPLVFPILEANQHGAVKADVILPSLESNKAYLHCCLTAAAVHQKSLGIATPETIDGDILRHKFAFVQEVVGSLGADANHLQVLEATLGMISLQCVTGQPEMEKDIPWHQHFQAATELVRKLNLPAALEELPSQGQGGHPPFNMTLTAWIDILGATMLGRAPVFADTYRNKHLAAASTGLTELMGCQDNVMYLLSEVACLDALRLDKRLDDIGICSHVQSLGRQLDATESPSEILQHPYSASGAIRPRQLSKNITAIFRKALRLYLCSLVPGFDRYGTASVNLISQMCDMLQYIPSGPTGFDRSLIWPMLVCGANSIPTSPFRKVFAERVEMLGDQADQGNIGRLLRVLHATWRRNDEVALSAGVCEVTPVTAGALSPAGSISTPTVSALSGTGVNCVNVGVLSNSNFSQRSQSVHWRDIMRDNGWDFLLI